MLNWKKSQDQNKEIVAMSPVLVYVWRPAEYEAISLYDWIRLSDKQRLPRPKKVKKEAHNAKVECDSDFKDNY